MTTMTNEADAAALLPGQLVEVAEQWARLREVRAMCERAIYATHDPEPACVLASDLLDVLDGIV